MTKTIDPAPNHTQSLPIAPWASIKFPESFRPACSGSIVPETCTSGRDHCRLSRAKLDSYGRNLIGAFVPVRESDFGCCGPLFGGELALQKVKLDPAGEPVS